MQNKKYKSVKTWSQTYKFNRVNKCRTKHLGVWNYYNTRFISPRWQVNADQEIQECGIIMITNLQTLNGE